LIIWKKPAITISRGHYNWQHEPCWYCVRKGKTAHWHGDHKSSTVWDVPVIDGEERTGHAAQKPVELMRRPILNHTEPGEGVYEPFCGSGTTLVASEMTGRRCYALELDEKFCDVIVTRWQNLTGKQAVLGDGDHAGCTFEHARQTQKRR
jgi:DNA modification methylase